MKLLYATAAAQDRPMSKAVPEILDMWGGEIFVFPNQMILPQAGNAMIYRVRPDVSDPNRCIFEIMSTRTYPAGQVHRARRPRESPICRTRAVAAHSPARPRQYPADAAGAAVPSCKQTWLASHYEKIILNMHQELDRHVLGTGRD